MPLPSSIQSVCVMAFPALGSDLSFMALSAIFGFGFAGNMTCVSLCVRQAVPINRFGSAIGVVMMVAWAGMASGGYVAGVLFDLSRSYTGTALAVQTENGGFDGGSPGSQGEFVLPFNVPWRTPSPPYLAETH